MHMRFWTKAWMTAAAVCLASFSATARQQGSAQQQTGDPVADAARKARESKKDAPKPKKVYTDDDFKRSAPEPAAPATARVSGSGAATKAGEATKTGDATKD